MSKTVLPHGKFLDPLQLFAEQLTAKFTAKSAGEPEDQLKSPVDQLFAAYGKITSRAIVLKGESATVSYSSAHVDARVHARAGGAAVGAGQTVEGYSKQKKFLDDVLDGELFKASELTAVPDEAREAPKVHKAHKGQEQLDIAT